MDESVNISARVTPELKEKVKASALKRGANTSQFVAQVLADATAESRLDSNGPHRPAINLEFEKGLVDSIEGLAAGVRAVRNELAALTKEILALRTDSKLFEVKTKTWHTQDIDIAADAFDALMTATTNRNARYSRNEIDALVKHLFPKRAS